jgi:hypothetical protein
VKSWSATALVTLSVLCAVVSSALASPEGRTASSAVEATSRRVDLTALCTTMLTGGIRKIQVRAASGVKQGSTSSAVPYAIVATGHKTPYPTLEDALAWITAGKPSREGTLGDESYRTRVTEAGTLGMRRGGCKQVSTKILLVKKGLRGGIASQLGERYDCETPKSVYVRIRATLSTPAQFRRRAGALRVSVPIAFGELAVRTPTGVPLTYATVAATGKAQLYTARRCAPD